MKNIILKNIKSPIIYILIICVFLQLKLYKTAPEYTLTGDSYSYYEQYSGGNVLKGEIEDFRTPGYPYFIRIIKAIGGEENLYEHVVLVQKMMFIISIIMVYHMMIKVTKNKMISTVVACIIGGCPYLVLFNTLILTESLGIFQVVLLMYITILYICKPRKTTATLTGVIIFFMIMNRPGFIYFIPVYLFFWILKYFFNKKEIKSIIAGLISIVICAFLILGYCGWMKHLTGNFMISSVTYINDLVSVADARSYTETNYEELIEVMQQAKGDDDDPALSWNAASNVRGMFQYSEYGELKSFLKEAKSSKKHLKYLINKFFTLSELRLGTLAYTPTNSEKFTNRLLELTLPLSFGFVYILLLYMMCCLIYRLFKYAEIDWFLAMTFVFIIANLFTLIVGAPFEPIRLFIISVIPTIMCIGYILSKCTVKPKEIDQENNLFYQFFLEKINKSSVKTGSNKDTKK